MTSSPPALGDALSQERTYHDACRAALAALVDGAGEQVVAGQDVSASGADAEVLGRGLRTRARDLRELPAGPLFFGRLDFAASEEAGDHAGQSYHIGRVRLAPDPSAPPLVVDWRAPVARAFYQAGPHDPRSVSVRRRFGWAPGSRGDSADLTGLEDEHLEEPDRTRPSAVVAAEIERPRIGPMRDIAATIQPEQDDLVRADLAASLCVQGAPGTGKTAVGLHRAAYLLYTYPERVRRGGMLVLGPNRAFLAHISEVLPTLGESGVRQSTLDDEIARHPVTAWDDDGTARVKHDIRMAEVLRRALYARVRPEAAHPLTVPDGSCRWRVSADELEEIVRGVRAEEPSYAVGRERVRSRVLHALRQRAELRTGPRGEAWARKVSRARPVTALLDAVWPVVRPEEVLADLLADRAPAAAAASRNGARSPGAGSLVVGESRTGADSGACADPPTGTDPETCADSRVGTGSLALAADGLLDTDERRRLLRTGPARSARTARWSAADLVLLDELAGLIERPAGYEHIVIDEAQDLSPMECRAIARRSPFGSLTVLGDLAQGTTPWAARSWPDLLRHLGKRDAGVTALTTGFRLPAAVAELANRLLLRLDVEVPLSRSLRRGGEAAVTRAGDLAAATVAAVREALGQEGSVAVIAADSRTAALGEALAAAGVPASGPDTPGARVTVVPASVAKGLEYDHVVVVEPAAVVRAEERGLHRLYVVLTRAVSRLHIVHHEPLPDPLLTDPLLTDPLLPDPLLTAGLRSTGEPAV
ncbi:MULTISPECIES: HelD family protein [unclassified Streptomyces]|uniref:HelD family protein n=1 Tax=unclassified Streptomyces TaxID=2593676 RepID=UPI0004ACBF40|nr:MULTISPECIES: AAA family ATPase [unclassified Streptomyces]SCE14138.1 DNA helicase IV [Streptomyces sp. DpondAA-D4]